MSGKQNFIFFLGLSLILMNFYFHGGFTVITHSIFGPGGIGNPNPPANQVPGGASGILNNNSAGNRLGGGGNPGFGAHLPGLPLWIPNGIS